MSESVPVADAMEEAQAVLDAEAPSEYSADVTFVDAAAGIETPASPPVQVPLFEPPPFDFEEAYDELQRLDRRAQNRRAAWESLKAASRDAKEDYDSAINDLHDKFDEIDSARRVAAAVRQAPKPAEPTTEGGEPQMPDLDETIDEPQEPAPQPSEEPTDETSSDAPGD